MQKIAKNAKNCKEKREKKKEETVLYNKKPNCSMFKKLLLNISKTYIGTSQLLKMTNNFESFKNCL